MVTLPPTTSTTPITTDTTELTTKKTKKRQLKEEEEETTKTPERKPVYLEDLQKIFDEFADKIKPTREGFFLLKRCRLCIRAPSH